MRQVKIGNKSYTIKLSYNAQKAWQEEHGKGLEELNEGVTMEMLISLIWYGLKSGSIIDGKDLDLTVETLAEMLDSGEVTKITTLLFSDIAASVNDATTDLKKNKLIKS